MRGTHRHEQHELRGPPAPVQHSHREHRSGLTHVNDIRTECRKEKKCLQEIKTGQGRKTTKVTSGEEW